MLQILVVDVPIRQPTIKFPIYTFALKEIHLEKSVRFQVFDVLRRFLLVSDFQPVFLE
jgi:hypothetical protein